MANPLNLLIVEDSEADIQLIVRALNGAGYKINYAQVQDPASVKAALAQQMWDAVLCDYSMPLIDSHAALELLRDAGLDTPFIILSGAIREELAVSLIKAGAHDFVSKANLGRLAPVLEREINQANLRRAHRLAVHARMKNEQRFRAIIESSPVPLAVNDDHGNITYLNPKFVQTFGYSIHDIPTLAEWWPLAYPDETYRAWVISTWQQAVEKAHREGKEVEPIELNIVCKDGTLRTVLAHPTPMDDSHLVYLYDVTTQKALQAQLVQTQKMESLSHLAGGLAHDFNNLLGIVIGNLDILETRLKGDDKSVAKIQTALRAALRGVDITRRMLTLSHLQNRKSDSDQAYDINTLIEEIVAILRGTLGPQYTIFTALLPELPRVKLDPSEFENVLLNLALNARDAMPDGGQIVMLTRQVPRENLLLLPNQLESDRAESYVLLEFSDTGHGMSAEVRERALDPFFTTKNGKGTGLGLAMAYSFVKDRKGHIQILSEVGAGTAIHIYLPAAQNSTTIREKVSSEIADMPRGSEKILVVDDEQDLLALTTGYLQSLGYHVVSASNGLDALVLLETELSIDLLLTDVVMPGGILGTELAVKAQQLRPTLPVILCSGFPKKVQDDATYARFAHDILPKPYRKTELAHAIRRKLDAQE